MEQFLLHLANRFEIWQPVIPDQKDENEFAMLLASLVGKPLGNVYPPEAEMLERTKRGELRIEISSKRNRFVKEAFDAVKAVVAQLRNEEVKEMEVKLLGDIEGGDGEDRFVFLHVRWC